ncbi:TIGR01620 family protein [Thalassotalea sp. Y01]|uniref:YcjF family protein n=1 Tax=Thalassotalea sp. Y01 TaxID=2729613 RepID=UPI00145C52DF|nr:TIGR01620 family protein [Thalassotalea sp. Y01]NMP17554.1 TIGR01620 family protein [Thalassotalea sp. Y01]
MSQDDKYQQHILFSEPEIKQASDDSDLPESQLVLPEQAWQAVEEDIVQVSEQQQRSKPNWLWRTVGVLCVTIMGYELVDFFATGFVESPIITSIYAALLGCIGVVAGKYVVKELTGLRQFNKQQHQYQQADALLHDETVFDAKSFCQNLTDNLPLDTHNDGHQQFFDTLDDSLSDKEVLELYSKQVLHQVDDQAVKQIAKFSSEAVLMVALSPLAVMDMLLLLWRNLKMVDKIAGLYGVRLGYWSRVRLLRQVITNMAYAGASEIVADVGLDMLGVDALGRFSTRAAQGLGAGMLTTRLGLKALYLCRPIPFAETQKRPGIAIVRGKVITQVKSLLSNKSKD